MAALHPPGRTAVLPAAMRLALKVLLGALSPLFYAKLRNVTQMPRNVAQKACK
jgi:hypothetical protein